MPSVQIPDNPSTQAIRAFNRFYTRKIGVLQEDLLSSGYSLTEVRILYEIANNTGVTATSLCQALDLDRGYLSRILKELETKKLVQKTPSPEDARSAILTLTSKGEREFAELNERSNRQVDELLDGLSVQERTRLLRSMQTIAEILDDSKPINKEPFILRGHQPGDLGWIVHRHGVLYAQEYHWDETFEALVAKIASDFLTNFDSKKEFCWIAERDDEILGSVMLVKESEEVAKLRLLLVEPKARGLGVGKRLVQECIKFARHRGYKKLRLWTNKGLDAARTIYEKAGFTLVEEEAHHSFGHDQVAQTWELDLA